MNLTVCQYDGFSMQSTFIVRWPGTLSPIITFFEADSERSLYGGGRNSKRIYQFGKKQIIEALQVHEPDRNPGWYAVCLIANSVCFSALYALVALHIMNRHKCWSGTATNTTCWNPSFWPLHIQITLNTREFMWYKRKDEKNHLPQLARATATVLKRRVASEASTAAPLVLNGDITCLQQFSIQKSIVVNHPTKQKG